MSVFRKATRAAFSESVKFKARRNRTGQAASGAAFNWRSLIKVGVWLDSLAVVIDHRFEGVEPAVVHVGGGEFDVAQGRRLEAADIGGHPA